MSSCLLVVWSCRFVMSSCLLVLLTCLFRAYPKSWTGPWTGLWNGLWTLDPGLSFGHILKAGLDHGLDPELRSCLPPSQTKTYSGITLPRHLLKFCRKREINNVFMVKHARGSFAFTSVFEGHGQI